MGLSWQAERDQAISMQEEADRQLAEYRARLALTATEGAVREGVRKGIQDALQGIELTPKQSQQLRNKFL